MKTFGLYTLSLLFVVAGAFHFIAPQYYKTIMPPYIPAGDFVIYFSGVCEIVLGLLLLWEPARTYAAWGLIALLVAVAPVHVHMLLERNTLFSTYPAIFLWLRLPLQCLVIFWVHRYV